MKKTFCSIWNSRLLRTSLPWAFFLLVYNGNLNAISQFSRVFIR
jgi:hypothetical protein